MKKFIYNLLMSVALVASFTACSDDDDVPVYTLPQNLDGINITTISDGNNMSGIQTTYALSADGKTVTLTMRGSAAGSKASEVPVIDPGYILPGAAEVILTFTPTIEATYASAEGSGESTFCTYKYRVTMTNTSMTVEFKDIVMNNGLIVSEITYTDADVEHMLELTYNGSPVLGKQLTITPKANDWTHATITISGATLDLSEMLATLSATVPLDLSALNSIPTSGVIPGTLSSTFDVTMDGGTFSGSGETEYFTFKYNGVATAEKMEFNITDATLKDTSLVGTWDLASGNNAIKLTWESSNKVVVGKIFNRNIEVDIQTIIAMILPMAIIPDGDSNQTIATMLHRAIKSVTFQADGNIVASYVPDAAADGTPVDSPMNLAQYVVASDNQLLIFLNPQSILMNVIAQSRGSRADGSIDMSEIQSIIDQLAPTLVGLVQSGAPIAYTLSDDENDLAVYLDTEFLLPILKAAAPLFENEVVIEYLTNAIQGSSSLNSTLTNYIVKLIEQMPTVIEGTTKIEAGLNLTKSASE